MDSVRFWDTLPHRDPDSVLAEGLRFQAEYLPLDLGRGELYFPDHYTWARGIDIDGNIAVLACDPTIEVVDIQDLTSPEPILTVSLPEGGFLDVEIHGNYFFVTNLITVLWSIIMTRQSPA